MFADVDLEIGNEIYIIQIKLAGEFTEEVCKSRGELM